MRDQKHLFALYLEEMPVEDQSPYEIENKEFIHRMYKVLRLSSGDRCILFNREQHAVAHIEELSAKKARVVPEEIKATKLYQPSITYLLPILKRDALEAAIYFLVETGVQHIHLIETKKIQRKWGGEKELNRLQRIIVAAAEQSLNFAFPLLHAPQKLETVLVQPPQGNKYVADPSGLLMASVINTESLISSKEIILTSGPEGDFTLEEKALLNEHSFTSVSLTPTILRAETAALCFSSIFRSVY